MSPWKSELLCRRFAKKNKIKKAVRCPSCFQASTQCQVVLSFGELFFSLLVKCGLFYGALFSAKRSAAIGLCEVNGFSWGMGEELE